MSMENLTEARCKCGHLLMEHVRIGGDGLCRRCFAATYHPYHTWHEFKLAAAHPVRPTTEPEEKWYDRVRSQNADFNNRNGY